MAYDAATRSAVRHSYVAEMLPLKAAATKHGIPYATVRNWKDESWDKARTAKRISSGGVEELGRAVIDDFVMLFQTTLDDLKQANVPAMQKAEAIARLSDAYQKTIKAAGASNPKLNKLAVAMDVIQQFANFLRDEKPEAALVFAEVIEPFAEQLAQRYG